MTSTRTAACLLTIVLVSFGGARSQAQTFIAVDDPLGVLGTEAVDISGNRIVGNYQDALGTYHGFVYDGAAYTTLDPPGSVQTLPHGIEGNYIVGEYRDQFNVLRAFIYDGSGYQTSPSVSLEGISGSKVVGTLRGADDAIVIPVVYDIAGGSGSLLDYLPAALPGSNYSDGGLIDARDISGDTVAGWYSDVYGIRHGYTSNVNTLQATVLDGPLGGWGTYWRPAESRRVGHGPCLARRARRPRVDRPSGRN